MGKFDTSHLPLVTYGGSESNTHTVSDGPSRRKTILLQAHADDTRGLDRKAAAVCDIPRCKQEMIKLADTFSRSTDTTLRNEDSRRSRNIPTITLCMV